MSSVRLREFQKMRFADPAPFLIKLREIERVVARSDLPEKVKQLRTNDFKRWRELREASLFAHFMGQRIGAHIQVGEIESQDYDFVMTWESKDGRHYAPTQMKEVVPAYMNPQANIQVVIDSLSKYTDSTDLSVVIHLNQFVKFDPASLVIPELPIGALWVFGSLTPDSNEWSLWGDFMVKAYGSRHEYPAA